MGRHNDDRDVFVLQAWGQKQWEVSASRTLPNASEQVGKDGKAVGRPSDAEDVTLKPGDVLYVPRGALHCAKCTGDDISVHFTIAVPTR